MKARVEDLKALLSVMPATGPRKKDSAVEALHLHASDGYLEAVCATDEVVLTSRIQAIGDLPPIAVEAKRFLSVTTLDAGIDMDLHVRNGQLLVSDTKRMFSFPAIPSRCEQAVPWSTDSQVTVQASTLGKALKRCIRHSARYSEALSIDGVAFLFREERLLLAGTDGGVLFISLLPVGNSGSESYMIPPLAARTVDRMCAVADKVHICRKDSGTLGFAAGGSVLDARVYADVRLPDYEGLMLCLDLPYTITASRDKLLEAVRAMEAQALKEEGCLWTLSTNRLLITTDSIAGSGQLEVEVTYEGDPTTVLLDPSLLRPGLDMVTGDEVTIRLGTPDQPLRIDEGKDSFFVMPMATRR